MAGINFAGAVAAVYNAITGRRVRYATWPALTGAGTPGAKLTTGIGAWGALADIVAASAIATDFWICGIMVRAGGAAQVFEIELENAAKAALFNCFFDPTAVTLNIGQINVPYPVCMVAKAQVQAKAGGAAAKDIFVGILYATLL